MHPEFDINESWVVPDESALECTLFPREDLEIVAEGPGSEPGAYETDLEGTRLDNPFAIP
jgi:hypothetical protein